MSLSRRTFIQTAAAIPLMTSGGKTKRVAVIGAGAFGGWTALHLRRMGADVTLVDAWGPGHTRSSSGGETRVIRAIYGPDRVYVEMVRRAYELWEELDASTGEQIYTPTGALWLHRGDDAYVRSSLAILSDLGFPVDKVPVEEAARRYPQIAFNGVRSVYLERRAGVLSARKACAVVRDAFVRAGGTYRTAGVQPFSGSVKLEDGSRLDADAYVFACGPWLGKLFPDVIGERVRPTRQEVFYFGTPRGSSRYAPPSLPVWIDFGERIVYGIPDIHGRGFKLADDTRGEPIDPSTAERRVSEQGIARARSLLKERFPELANAPLIASEVCQYENSPDGHLIVDRHPTAEHVWLAGGGSGHGFKLAPALGEIVARSVLGRGEIPATFSLERLRNFEAPKTQFERK